jgi:hypothetical protein
MARDASNEADAVFPANQHKGPLGGAGVLGEEAIMIIDERPPSSSKSWDLTPRPSSTWGHPRALRPRAASQPLICP